MIKYFDNMSIFTSVILLTISLAIFSIAIPLMDEHLNSYNFEILESQGQMNQSEIRNASALAALYFSNYLLTHKDYAQRKDLQELRNIYMESAVKNQRFRYALLYIAMQNKYPDNELLNKWAKMNYNELEDDMDKSGLLKSEWKEKARKEYKYFPFLKNVLYGLAILLNIIGLLGVSAKEIQKVPGRQSRR